MRGFGCRSIGTGWVLMLVLGLTLAACGSGGLFGDLAAAELWDPRDGQVVAKPQAQVSLTVEAFEGFIQTDANRATHLQMAEEMGYATVRAAARVTYDNGTVMTTAALSGETEGDLAVLVVGDMPGAGETSDPPEAVFIAEPVFEEGKLARVHFVSDRGELNLDPGTGQVDLIRAEYGSCATWNCLAGAIFFWWQDNSAGMEAYWGTAGEACMDCIALPHSAPVACPICAAFLGAVVLASVTDCTIWPCDLCVSDSCHLPEYENQRCVTENGASEVRQSVTNWVCENPRTQQAECVRGTTVTETESCPWGCRPGSPTCMWSTQCLVDLNLCPSALQGTWCVGDDLRHTYEKQGCVSDDPLVQNEWGSCVPTGQYEFETSACPYTCTNYSSPTGGFEGQCDPPPTCDPALCEQFQRPVGDPYCMVRPDDNKSVVVREIEPYGCVSVEPRVAVPADWPEGQTCQALDRTLQVVDECPAGCSFDGLSCADVDTTVTLIAHLPSGPNDLTTLCPFCAVRLWSWNGVESGWTGADGLVTLYDVAPGEYTIEYGCGPASAGPHQPDDLIPNMWPERYFSAWKTWPPSAGSSMLVTPATEPVDIFLEGCP